MYNVYKLYSGTEGGKWTDWKDVISRSADTEYPFPFPMKTVLIEITDTEITNSPFIFIFKHAGGYNNPKLGISIYPDRVNIFQDCINEPTGEYIEGIGTWRIKKTPTQVTTWFNSKFYTEYTFEDRVSALTANPRF